MVTGFAFAYLLFLAAVLGLVFGSFGNAWAWRVLHGENIARGRSHCPHCEHTLGAGDLIPLLSYLFLRGRCRYCGAPISPRYPAAEAVCCVVFVSAALRFGLTLDTLSFAILGFLLLCLSLCDLEQCIIPDRFLVLAGANFLVFALLSPERGSVLLHGLTGGAALFVPMLVLVLLFDRLLGRETMGGGDLKLLFILGLYLGAAKGLLMLLLACLIGLAFAFVPALRGKDASNPRAFPFGPSLAIAAWLVILCGDAVLTWYLGLF